MFVWPNSVKVLPRQNQRKIAKMRVIGQFLKLIVSFNLAKITFMEACRHALCLVNGTCLLNFNFTTSVTYNGLSFFISQTISIMSQMSQCDYTS